jgi:hypothetical protein
LLYGAVFARLKIQSWLGMMTLEPAARMTRKQLLNLTRQGLSKIHKDPDRRRWYLGAEADDEGVDVALEFVR